MEGGGCGRPYYSSVASVRGGPSLDVSPSTVSVDVFPRESGGVLLLPTTWRFVLSSRSDGLLKRRGVNAYLVGVTHFRCFRNLSTTPRRRRSPRSYATPATGTIRKTAADFRYTRWRRASALPELAPRTTGGTMSIMSYPPRGAVLIRRLTRMRSSGATTLHLVV